MTHEYECPECGASNLIHVASWIERLEYIPAVLVGTVAVKAIKAHNNAVGLVAEGINYAAGAYKLFDGKIIKCYNCNHHFLVF